MLPPATSNCCHLDCIKCRCKQIKLQLARLVKYAAHNGNGSVRRTSSRTAKSGSIEFETLQNIVRLNSVAKMEGGGKIEAMTSSPPKIFTDYFS